MRRFRVRPSAVFKILETLVMMLLLVFSLQEMVTIGEQRIDQHLFVFIYVLLSLAYTIKAVKERGKKKRVVRFSVTAGMYLVGAALGVYLLGGQYFVSVVSLVFLVYIIFARTMSLVEKRSKKNVILAILCGIWVFLMSTTVLYLFYGDFPLYEMSLIIVMSAYFSILALVRIIQLSLSHIRYDILIKVIKRSMAAEILSGLGLLIIAFSFVFSVIEPDMPNVWSAMWYCFALITTIGFGDVVAQSILGKVLSVILGIYGIIVVSLITSIIVNFYSEIKEEDKQFLISQEDKSKKDSKPDDRSETDSVPGSTGDALSKE